MAVRKCCINNCQSSSTRKEDTGVTYHKFPKKRALRQIWLNVTRYDEKAISSTRFVCSRHFRKVDFQNYKDHKYVLKSDAVPSFLPWNMESTETIMANNRDKSGTMEKSETSEDNVAGDSEHICGVSIISTSLVINDQDKKSDDHDQPADNVTKQDDIKEENVKIEADDKDVKDFVKPFDEPMLTSVTSVVDIVFNQSHKSPTKKETKEKKNTKNLESDKPNSSMSLSVGARVEAKDFSELWYAAQIVEVDYDEMEVLVHYDNLTKRHDEWISVNSPRLRPLNEYIDESPELIPRETLQQQKEPKLLFEVGERCLARWSDNRRFPATIRAVLPDGKYEIIFDDGFIQICTSSRLFKVKQPSGSQNGASSSPHIINTTKLIPKSLHTSCLTPVPYCARGDLSPSVAVSLSSSSLPATPVPFHKHLFDPTRDYLGPKSERREMKRKLNIKDLFNIGQSRRKQSTDANSQKRSRQKKVSHKSVKNENNAIVGTQKQADPITIDNIPMKIDEIKIEPQEVKIDNETAAEEKILKLEQTENKLTETSDVKDTVNDVKDEGNVLLDSKIIVNTDNLESKTESEELLKYEIKDLKQENEENKESSVIPKEESKQEDSNQGSLNSDIPLSDIQNEASLSNETDAPLLIEKNTVTEQKFPEQIQEVAVDKIKKNKIKKNMLKIKKARKLRSLQDKIVKKEVEEVRKQVEEMKRQVEEMKKQVSMSKKIEHNSDMLKCSNAEDMELLDGEWCCRWVNGQPQGIVSEVEWEVPDALQNKPVLPRRSVQVQDKRLPPGWTKHMVRRSYGSSAGKWNVVLMSPDNRKFHSKNDMRVYLDSPGGASLREYDRVLLDFGVYRKLSRRLGWDTVTESGRTMSPVKRSLPVGTLCTTSPIFKTKKLFLKRKPAGGLVRKPKPQVVRKRKLETTKISPADTTVSTAKKKKRSVKPLHHISSGPPTDKLLGSPPLEDGFVYVGSLKVQVIENLLRCPADGCYKNFRNNNLLQMHIKHYHRELKKMMGATPKVLDLAYARTIPVELSKPTLRIELEAQGQRVKTVKTKRVESNEVPRTDVNLKTPIQEESAKLKLQDSPKLRKALVGNVSKKRPKVLLPVRRLDEQFEGVGLRGPQMDDIKDEMFMSDDSANEEIENSFNASKVDYIEPLDFEAAISTHTVTKPIPEKPPLKRKYEKRKQKAMPVAEMLKHRSTTASEDDDWYLSDLETRSSCHGSLTPDSKMENKFIDTPTQQLASSESNEEQREINTYVNEIGEKIKIVHMKREEIINCHCGFREEDGLMIQCELCLCWQHALCHNIQRESEVPEKYTCSICLNPKRGRRSQRFLYDQDRLYEGLLPGAKPCESLRRSHELSGNLLRIEDSLQALRVKYYVASKKDHPKLYLWAKDWENGDSFAQDKSSSEYVDFNTMISEIGKENLPIKSADGFDTKTPCSEELEEQRLSQKDGSQLGSQGLLSNFMSSPGGGSLELPISTSELERLAKSVQDCDTVNKGRITAPQPEAAIENSACRERLLRHIQRCQALIDARLDSIEAQVAELESQDPSFEDDETADYFPRTKQTIQMLLRDLDTMEELGIIT